MCSTASLLTFGKSDYEPPDPKGDLTRRRLRCKAKRVMQGSDAPCAYRNTRSYELQNSDECVLDANAPTLNGSNDLRTAGEVAVDGPRGEVEVAI